MLQPDPNIPENNSSKEFNISPTNLIRLREVFVINSLKKQILQLKQLLNSKEEEVEHLKVNAKCSKYSKLEYNHSVSEQELENVKKEYDKVRINYDITFEKLKSVTEERDYCKNMMGKFKAQYDEAKEKLKLLENENEILREVKRSNDEKIVYLTKFSKRLQGNTKIALKETKEEEVQNNALNASNARLSSDLAQIKYDKGKLEKKNADLIKEIKSCKEEVESKNEKIKSAETNLSKLKEEMTNKLSKTNEKISSMEKEIEFLSKEKVSNHSKILELENTIKQHANSNTELSSKVSEMAKVRTEERQKSIKTEAKLLEDLQKLKKKEEELVQMKKKEVELVNTMKKQEEELLKMKEIEKENLILKTEKSLIIVNDEIKPSNDGDLKDEIKPGEPIQHGHREHEESKKPFNKEINTQSQSGAFFKTDDVNIKSNPTSPQEKESSNSIKKEFELKEEKCAPKNERVNTQQSNFEEFSRADSEQMDKVEPLGNNIIVNKNSVDNINQEMDQVIENQNKQILLDNTSNQEINKGGERRFTVDKFEVHKVLTILIKKLFLKILGHSKENHVLSLFNPSRTNRGPNLGPYSILLCTKH
jgi:hypothetical protein